MPTSSNPENATHNVCPAHCPLCGGPNACALVAGTAAEQRCWCCDVQISRETLDKIPAAARNVACLCQSCATGQAASASPPTSVRCDEA